MNVLLTGERQVGKSTAITRYLDSLRGRMPFVNIRGFKTVSAFEREDGDSIVIMPYERATKDAKRYKPVADRFDNAKGLKIYPEIFDGIGAALIKDSMDSKPDLIMMDEIGFMERDATVFQKTVLKALTGPIPVLGVIKPMEDDFLTAVRETQGTFIIDVDENCRDEVPERIKNLLAPFIGDEEWD